MLAHLPADESGGHGDRAAGLGVHLRRREIGVVVDVVHDERATGS
jgi:hypothetical protein